MDAAIRGMAFMEHEILPLRKFVPVMQLACVFLSSRNSRQVVRFRDVCVVLAQAVLLLRSLHVAGELLACVCNAKIVNF